MILYVIKGERLAIVLLACSKIEKKDEISLTKKKKEYELYFDRRFDRVYHSIIVHYSCHPLQQWILFPVRLNHWSERLPLHRNLGYSSQLAFVVVEMKEWFVESVVIFSSIHSIDFSLVQCRCLKQLVYPVRGLEEAIERNLYTRRKRNSFDGN